MEENDSKGFKISFDDDESSKTSQGDSGTPLPVQKFSPRITVPLVLIPFLFFMGLAVLYYHLNSKIASIQSSGTTKVESLTKNFQVKLKEITDQTDQINTKAQKAINQLEKEIKSVSGSLGKNKTSLNKSVSAKASKNDLQKAAANINKKIKTLQKTIETISSDIKSLDSNLTKKFEKKLEVLTKNADGITKDLDTLQAEMKKISEQGIDQRKLDFALDLQAKSYKTELKQAMMDIQKEMSAILKEAKKSRTVANPQIKSLPPIETSSSPVNATKKTKVIVEQDLSD